MGLFLDQIIGTKWRSLPENEIKGIIRNISSMVQEYVNKMSYNETQKKDYNSKEENFRVQFKQEMIAKSCLMVRKKRYAYALVEEDHAPSDKMVIKGLEIVRSDTPGTIRVMLKEIMKMILHLATDEELMDKIEDCKVILSKCAPDEIAVNIGVHRIDKYLDDDDNAKKGTPWHVKGIANYNKLLKKLDIVDKYEEHMDETKLKVIYVKKNAFNVDMIAFIEWPSEFDAVLQVDQEKMIEKYFVEKVKILLDPMNKLSLLSSNNSKAISLFF
jgi:hypothetical protein